MKCEGSVLKHPGCTRTKLRKRRLRRRPHSGGSSPPSMLVAAHVHEGGGGDTQTVVRQGRRQGAEGATGSVAARGRGWHAASGTHVPRRRWGPAPRRRRRRCGCLPACTPFAVAPNRRGPQTLHGCCTALPTAPTVMKLTCDMLPQEAGSTPVSRFMLSSTTPADAMLHGRWAGGLQGTFGSGAALGKGSTPVPTLGAIAPDTAMLHGRWAGDHVSERAIQCARGINGTTGVRQYVRQRCRRCLYTSRVCAAAKARARPPCCSAHGPPHLAWKPQVPSGGPRLQLPCARCGSRRHPDG